MNFAGAATTISIGASTGTTTVNNALTSTGTLSANGSGGITTAQTTFSLVNATATTVNFAGAATTVNIGASTGTTAIKNSATIAGNLGITYTPATATGVALTTTGKDTVGGTGYFDFFKATNTTSGGTCLLYTSPSPRDS